MRWVNIILAYFVIGAVMWGAGLIAWSQAGVGLLFIDSPANGVDVNENTTQDVEQSGGPIQQAASTVSGPLVAVWNLLVRLIGYLTWPITVLQSVGAPPRIIVLLGGTPTVGFFATLIGVIRGLGT